MEEYSEYKDSGVKWLGKIPSHWRVSKFKYLFKTKVGITFTKAQLEIEGDPVISYGQIHSKDNKGTFINPNLIRHIPSVLTKGKNEVQAYKGDFLFADTSEDIEGCGNYVCVDTCFPIYAGYHTILARKNNKECYSYLAYLFTSQKWRCQIRYEVSGVKVYSITQNILNATSILLPPVCEQQAIADYLDAITTKIDEAIAQQHKMIDLLNERKQIIINNAVTKGLNPNVPMKDSGVDWLGEIPENWNLFRLKYLLNERLMYGANESAESDNTTFPRYIRITDIDENGNLRDDTFKSLPPKKAKPYLLKKGDILLARSGATAGKSFLFEGNIDACFAGYLIKASFSSKIIPRFFMYYTYSGVYDKWKKGIFIQATIPNIGADKYANLTVLLPSINEQNEIIYYLDRETEKINNAIEYCRQKISLFQERKQIIINEVVTGKVKMS